MNQGKDFISSDHDFREMTDTERVTFGYPVIIGKKYWYCRRCQSVVRYSSDVDQRTVNKLTANSMLCMKPV